ncbi:MAG: DUF296 domain-containing protein [Cyanobacteria bacterium J06621_11]
MELVSFRLESGADIRRDLENLIKRDSISAAVVMGAVGSLSNVCLRFAGQNRHTTLGGNSYEILTLSGTLGEGGVHLHMSVADSLGECKGGHVVYGCRVNTTLELVIALLPHVSFMREMDENTGYKELKIAQRDDSLEEQLENRSEDSPEQSPDEFPEEMHSEEVPAEGQAKEEQSEELPEQSTD